jgi:hypothetical protein
MISSNMFLGLKVIALFLRFKGCVVLFETWHCD